MVFLTHNQVVLLNSITISGVAKTGVFFIAKPGGNAITALLFQVLQNQVVPKLYKIRWFPCVCIAVSGGSTSGCFSAVV